MDNITCFNIGTNRRTYEFDNMGDFRIFWNENATGNLPEWVSVYISVTTPNGVWIEFGPRDIININMQFLNILRNLVTRIYNSDDPYTDLRRGIRDLD